MAAAPPPDLSVDVRAQAFLADPYPYYARLREHDPVHWDAVAQCWWVTRYADVAAAFHDPRLSVETLRYFLARQFPDLAGDAVEPILTLLGEYLVFVDPPRHTRLRALISKAFTPQVVEGLRPRIQQLVDALLDRVTARREMDVVADLANPLPATVIFELLGVPEPDREQFRAWCDDVVTIPNNTQLTRAVIERARASAVAMIAYLRELCATYRQRPADNLISRLVAVEEGGDRLSEAELHGTCAVMLTAGHETSTKLIGQGTLALLRHPDQLARLRDDPTLIERGVDELLRYDPPLQATSRLATADLTIGGQAIKAGEDVLLVVGAANRDPAQFPDPDRLDVGREQTSMATFSFGAHYCLGAPLARLEGQLALGTLLRRCPAVALATDAFQWAEPWVFRRLESLPVTW